MNQSHRLIPAAVMRREYFGGVSRMWEWRHRKEGNLPAPIKVGKRNFYRESDIIAVQERMAKASGSEPQIEKP